MTSLAEKTTFSDSPQFDFTIDRSISRIREHALALDRCKRYTEVPRAAFHCGLSHLEWSVFGYYYSLAPMDHPSEFAAAKRMKIGRATLKGILDSLASRGMIFFDVYTRTKTRIIHIANPYFWTGFVRNEFHAVDVTDPFAHTAHQLNELPERINHARDCCHEAGTFVRLPYLLFQLLLQPAAKFLYGLLCLLDQHVHPTVKELGAAMNCCSKTVTRQIETLESVGMIYTEIREPEKFGDHIRYYYHLTDIAHWQFAKARQWYPGGENSLLARIARRNASTIHLRKADDLQDFKPDFCAKQIPLNFSIAQVDSQISRNVEDQVDSQITQVDSQISRNVEDQVDSQITQVDSQISRNVEDQVDSQITQVDSQITQVDSQITQVDFQISEKSLSKPYAERVSRDFENAKNTYINKTNNKNTEGKHARAERWAPVAISFHPRLINIAQAGSVAWKARDYKCDRALWNSAVEQIAIERNEDEAIRFVDFVKSAYYAYGREFPYTPQLMQQFLNTFRSGESWSAILGPGYQDPEEAKSALEGEIQNPPPGAQVSLQIEAEFTEQERATQSPAHAQEGRGASENAVAPVAISPEVSSSCPDSKPDAIDQCQSEQGGILSAGDIDPAPSDEAIPIPAAYVGRTSGGLQTPVRVQITHANLLDVPAAMIRPVDEAKSTSIDTANEKGSPARSQSSVVDTASEKNSTPRSSRRIELEKAAAILTAGMKSQASFREGFAKLNDEKFYNMLLHMFGADRVQKLVAE